MIFVLFFVALIATWVGFALNLVWLQLPGTVVFLGIGAMSILERPPRS